VFAYLEIGRKAHEVCNAGLSSNILDHNFISRQLVRDKEGILKDTGPLPSLIEAYPSMRTKIFQTIST
jgi:hypothetical protein